MWRSRCGVGKKRSDAKLPRACGHVSDVGVVPLSGRRLRKGRDQGHRVVGSVSLLERGLDGADRVGDDPWPVSDTTNFGAGDRATSPAVQLGNTATWLTSTVPERPPMAGDLRK